MASNEKNELARLRAEIDSIDRGLLRLFEQRMAVSRAIGEEKKRQNLPVFVPERELEVLNTRAAWLENPAYASAAKDFFRHIMHLSRELQKELGTEEA